MELPERLLEWDQLDLRIRGTRAERLVSELILQRRLPVSDLRLNFLDGRIEISARIHKGIAIPVSFTVSAISAAGSALRIPLENVATFGLVPIPRMLFRFVSAARMPDGIALDPDSLVISIDLSRLAPPFVDFEIQQVRIIRGGLAVRLGMGGADLPPAAVH